MRLLIWDLDGTLAYREGGNWSAAIVEIAAELDPARGLTVEELRPHLTGRFLWEAYQQPQPHLGSPEAWWAAQTDLLTDALVDVGYPPARAFEIAGRVRGVYANPERFHLFSDTLPTLSRLSERGWTHAVLSNHVPELRQIMQRLGLLPAVDRLFNSAETGFCKPHREAFHQVLRTYPQAREVWMIGDNPEADYGGARAAGLPAILVRQETSGIEPFCPTLDAVAALID